MSVIKFSTLPVFCVGLGYGGCAERSRALLLLNGLASSLDSVYWCDNYLRRGLGLDLLLTVRKDNT